MNRALTCVIVLAACADDDPVEWNPAGGDAFGDTNLLFQEVAAFGELVGPHALGSEMQLDVLVPSDSGDWTFRVLEPSIAEAVLDTRDGSNLLQLLFLQEGTTDLYAIDGDGAVVDVESLRVRMATEARVTPYEELQFARAGVAPEPLSGEVHTVQGGLLDLVVSFVDRNGARLAGGNVLAVDADFPARIDHLTLFTGEVDVLSLDVGDRAPVETLPMVLTFGGALPLATLGLVVHDADDVDEVQIEVAEAEEDDVAAAIARVSAGGETLSGARVVFRWDGVSEEGSVLLIDTDSEVESTSVEACFEGGPEPICASTDVPGEPTGVLSRSSGQRGCGCASTLGPSSRAWGWAARRR